MDLHGTKTEKNLEAAFSSELRARNRYMYFADIADHAGREDVGHLFRAIAHDESEHARQEYAYLDRPRDNVYSLESAVRHESRDALDTYPAYAATAREEGFEEIASVFDRLGKMEQRHLQLFETALACVNEGKPLPARTIRQSAITMTELVLPNQTNPAGLLHGGEMVKLMDNAAGVVASRHSRAHVVTARIEEINFLRPIHVGNLVLIDSALTFVSQHTMEVRVQVTTENRYVGTRERAVTAYFIMVALDSEGRPTNVPPLFITSEEEERLFEEGRRRYEAHKKARQAQ